MWVFPNIGVPPKWMVYNGKPYEQMDDLGGFPPIFGLTPMYIPKKRFSESFQLPKTSKNSRLTKT